MRSEPVDGGRGAEKRLKDEELLEDDMEDQRVAWRELIGCGDSF